jgi:folate-dependent phosphoribosylglycinamide formyltransferase PurN
VTATKEAADLPDGSVVATDVQAWVKHGNLWRGTGDDSGIWNHWVQEELDRGAVVLREGH